jgi:hypothetical protein
MVWNPVAPTARDGTSSLHGRDGYRTVALKEERGSCKRAIGGLTVRWSRTPPGTAPTTAPA